MSTKPIDPNTLTVICTYRVKPGEEDAFKALLAKHWPALKSVGLATDDRPLIYVGKDDTGGPVFTEIFTWTSANAPQLAHEKPEVMAVWEPMGAICEPRGDRPPMEFPHVATVEIDYGS